VKIKDTVRAFKGILDGEFDHISEQCFNMCGPIEDVIKNYEQLQK